MKWYALALVLALQIPVLTSAQGATPISTPAAMATPTSLYLSDPSIVDRLPVGRDDTVDAVYFSRISTDGTSVFVGVRNNTDQSVGQLSINVTARAGDGSLSGVGSSDLFFPRVIGPGNIAITTVEIEGAAEAGDAPEFAVVFGTPTDTGVDLTIDEANVAGENLIGFARSPSDVPVNGPTVIAACFDDTLAIRTWNQQSLDSYTLTPHEVVPFSVKIGETCPNFMIAAGTSS